MTNSLMQMQAKSTMEDSGQLFDNNRNPLLHHVVLRNLFGLIPFKHEEFKNFRLVCHVWNDCASPFVHRNTWLKLDGSNNYDAFIDDDGKVTFPQTPLLQLISECLQESHDLSLSPVLKETLRFKKYYIEKTYLWRLYEPIFFNNFWEKFGPVMSHLEISGSYMNAQALRRIMFELTPNLQVFTFHDNDLLDPVPTLLIASNVLVWREEFRPQQSSINRNLTHLTIKDENIGSGTIPLNWIDIVCHFPNIKVLKLSTHDWKDRDILRSLEKFFKAVILVRQNCGEHHLAKLEHLDLIENPETMPLKRVPLKILRLLGQLDFPLSTLALDVGSKINREGRIALKTTLELYSSSLQNLTVCRGCWPIRTSFPFLLPHLTQLMLIGYYPKNLEFLKNLPVLKVCVLMDGGSGVGVLNMKKEWSTMYSSTKFGGKDTIVPFSCRYRVIEKTKFSSDLSGVVLPNLETFVVGTELCDWKQIKHLAKLMPNIKTLQLGMVNASFRKVCKYWSKLEHLHVEPMDVNEDGIFGVRNGERYRWPNIMDLKGLKTISLGHSSHQRRRLRQNVTDDDAPAEVLLPNLEAALNGRDVEIYRKPISDASYQNNSTYSSGLENDD